jgi:hypothetical protein
MATVAAPCADYRVVSKLRNALSELPAVRSVFVHNSDKALHVWVDITEDTRPARDAVYHFEDQISEMFPALMFDFHVVPVPRDRRLEDFVSSAQRVFQRSA